MAVPVRPVFQNGQRLTAERLNAALEFLRTTVRRLSLGPLSAGVAAGLVVGPLSPNTSDRVTVGPGVAIDGQGRLIILEFGRTFTVSDLEAEIGGQFRSGDTLELRLSLDENAGSPNECGPNQEVAVLENAVLQVVRTAATSTSTAAVSSAVAGVAAGIADTLSSLGFGLNFNAVASAVSSAAIGLNLVGIQPQLPPVNCVDPWADLDAPRAGANCSVTLGHITRSSTGQLQVLTDRRQGVSAQLGRIRNANGNPAMFFGESTTSETGRTEMIRATDPFVADGQVVVNNRSRFHSTATFDQLFGGEVQATHFGDNGTTSADQVAGMWLVDRRVFVVAGGAGNFSGAQSLPVRQGGVSGVQMRVHPSAGGSLTRAGVPLFGDVSNGFPVVREFLPGFSRIALVGLSAAASTFMGVGRGQAGTMRVVPVATSGLVPVSLVANAGFISVGTPLTVDLTETTKLRPSTDEKNVLARAAQFSDGTATQILAWVVHPPQNLTATIIVT